MTAVGNFQYQSTVKARLWSELQPNTALPAAIREYSITVPLTEEQENLIRRYQSRETVFQTEAEETAYWEKVDSIQDKLFQLLFNKMPEMVIPPVVESVTVTTISLPVPPVPVEKMPVYTISVAASDGSPTGMFVDYRLESPNKGHVSRMGIQI